MVSTYIQKPNSDIDYDLIKCWNLFEQNLIFLTESTERRIIALYARIEHPAY